MSRSAPKGRQKAKGRKASIPTSDLVPIVGDALIAGPDAEGRGVPLLILDTTGRPLIEDLVRVHSFLSPGDATSQWGVSAANSDVVVLWLTFQRPMSLSFGIAFSIEDQGVLVDAAVAAEAIYIQAGRPGDRLIHDVDRPKVLVELFGTEFTRDWDQIFLQRMTDVISRREGMPRRKARPLAQDMIDELRVLTGFRMRRD